MFRSRSRSLVPMKVVYRLSRYLEENPEEVAQVQALTLNENRPDIGLLGRNGLFGSDDWWKRVEAGKVPRKSVSGVIVRAYSAGFDESDQIDMIEIEVGKGKYLDVGIYVNDLEDLKYFSPGHLVEMVYLMEELKRGGRFSGRSYSDIALEVRISLESVD